MESSSRFATYVAFGLFCFAITIPIIRRAFFIGAILYLAIAFETVDIFLNDLLIIHVYSTYFLLADVFSAVEPTGRFSSRAFFDAGAVTVAQFDFFSNFFCSGWRRSNSWFLYILGWNRRILRVPQRASVGISSCLLTYQG